MENEKRSGSDETNNAFTPELGRLLEGIKPYPAVHSLILESLSDNEWEGYIDSISRDLPNIAEQ